MSGRAKKAVLLYGLYALYVVAITSVVFYFHYMDSGTLFPNGIDRGYVGGYLQIIVFLCSAVSSFIYMKNNDFYKYFVFCLMAVLLWYVVFEVILIEDLFLSRLISSSLHFVVPAIIILGYEFFRHKKKE